MSSNQRALVVHQIRNEIDIIDEVLTKSGFEDWRIRSKHGQRTLVGKTRNGETFRLSIYGGNGFSEQTLSRCSPLTPKERREEARRLRKLGFTQAEIADRLGVSQKTISNDLAQITTRSTSSRLISSRRRS